MAQQQAASPKAWDRRPEGWDRVAEGYRRGIQPLMEPFAADLVRFAGVRSGMHVLDVAAGPGTVAFRLAEGVRPGGHVDAVDFAPRMVDALQAEVRRRGLESVVAPAVRDGQTLAGIRDAQYDLLTSQFGLIFFPDALAGLRAAHRVLKPGGLLAVTSWGPMPRNPFLTVFLRAVQAHVPPKPNAARPAVFHLSDDGELEALVEQAGFADVRTQVVRHPWGAPGPEAYWDLMVGGSPAVKGFLEEAPVDLRGKIRDSFLASLRDDFPEGPVRFEAEARLVRASK